MLPGFGPRRDRCGAGLRDLFYILYQSRATFGIISYNIIIGWHLQHIAKGRAVSELVLILGIAILAVGVFRRLGLPSIIGLLFAGVLAGPHSLGLVKSSENVEALAEIGVVLLLFTLGMEFSFASLVRIRRLALGGGALQLGATILTIAAACAAFGLPLERSVFMGFLAALSSTAIIIKLMMDSGELDAPHGRAALGILIFQDLCVVPLVLFTPFLAGEAGGPAAAALVAAKAAAVLIGAHIGARWAIPWLFRQVAGARSRELFVLTVIFVGLGTAWLTALAGLSMALGAFIAGLAISESEYSHQALGDMLPFRDAFLSIFFVSVGMLLDPSTLFTRPAEVILLVALILAVKTVITSASVLAVGLPARFAVLTGLALAQVGEFSFVLAHEGMSHGLMSNVQYQLFLAASIITMSLTPYTMKYSGSVSGFVAKHLPASLAHGRGALVQDGPATDRLSDHVVIVGFGPVGRDLARALGHIGAGWLAIETNPFTVRERRAMGERIIFGDASNEEVLSHAMLRKARALVVAVSDPSSARRIVDAARRMNPLIHIIVRTRYVVEVEPLYALGASEVVAEEYETSIEILARVMGRFLVDHDSIEDYIADVRKDGYGMLRSLDRKHTPAAGLTSMLFGADVATLRVRPGCALDGTSIAESMIRRRTGAIVLAIKRAGDVVTNPDPSWELAPDDAVLVIGTPAQLAAASSLFEACDTPSASAS